MNESQWDAKLKSFLKKTGDDFKRFGTDVKEEAQKLLTEVQDPARQQKLRDGLKDVGVWAKKTAEEVATLVETGVKKAEGAIGKASDKVNDFVVKPVEPPPAAGKTAAPASTPPSPPPQMDEAPPPAPKKTVGKGGAKKKPAARKSPPKKTIGKKGPASQG
jgi:hypothetical protein